MYANKEEDKDSQSHDVLPTGEGVMIIDEVKVSMSPTSLRNVYIAHPPTTHYNINRLECGWCGAAEVRSLPAMR